MPLIRLSEASEHLLEAVDAFGLDPHPATLYPAELQRRPGDDPGQSETADRRPMLSRRRRSREFALGAAGRDQRHRFDVRGDGAGDVVILAVDVARECPPDRDEPRPGCHRQEPTQRQYRLEDGLERASRLDIDLAGCFVEAKDAQTATSCPARRRLRSEPRPRSSVQPAADQPTVRRRLDGCGDRLDLCRPLDA